MAQQGLARATRPLVAALALAWAAACSSGENSSLNEEARRRLDRVLSTLMEENGVPGALFGVWVPGEGSWVASRGLADAEAGRRISKADGFRIGSITKTLTTTVVLQLVDEGRIGLDDPVGRYVSGVPAGDAITIRQLCNNTSGLFNYGDDPDLLQAIEQDPLRKWTPRELVDVSAAHPLYFPPGESFRYSNTNFVLLGMIIEGVTGRSAAEEIERRIVEPLDLERTDVPDVPGIEGRFSRGYGDAGLPGEDLVDLSEYLDPSLLWTAGAAVSSLWDLRTWARAIGQGALLSEGMQEERMTLVEIPGEQGIRKYGLGVFATGPLIGHDGTVPGYDSAMYVLPANGTVFVAFFNKTEEQVTLKGLQMVMAAGTILFPEEMPW